MSETESDQVVSREVPVVQQHVDAIVGDLTAGRVSREQRAVVKRALDDAAVGGMGRMLGSGGGFGRG